MSGGIEAAADVVSSGLIGRAVEPRAGETQDGGAHGLCLNCGTALIGAHCHACGQSGHVHRTVGAIGHEIAHGVFHFEGKIWRTLPMLALRPGELTRRYIAGERARFVSPLAVFLFSVFLLFAIVASLPGWNFGDSEFLKPGVQGGMAEARIKLGEERERAETSLAENRIRLSRERADSAPDPERIDRLTKRVAAAEKASRDLATAEKILPAPTTIDVDDAPISSNSNWLEAKFLHAKENPKLMLYKMKMSAYKYSWALIPLSVPFLWLLFPFSRRFGMYDHAVFATYSLTFMSLLTIALALLGTIGVPTWVLTTAGSIVPPIHIYKQMKGAYGLGRWSALARTTLLVSLIFAIIVPMFAVGLVYLGVAD